MEKEFIEVSKEDSEQIMQPIYKYMPLIMFHNGEMISVVAQKDNKVYYVK